MSISEILSSIYNAFIQTSILEWMSFICALTYILLIAFENSWGWLFGIIASLLTVYLCFSCHLFFESGLNLFYVVIGFYGWYQWLHGSDEKKEIRITHLSITKNGLVIIAGVLIWLPFAFFAKKYSTQVLPYLDAFITIFSIIATWMTAKKRIENWLYWIILDSLGIYLFANRGFYLFALLNIIYVGMSVGGYFSWRKKSRS